MAAIEPIVMPKWGLAMQEGLLSAWLVPEGSKVQKGQDLADIESSKIANVFECPGDGLLRRRVAAEGDTLPVGALIAVLAEPAVAEADIDAFVAEFQARFVSTAADGPAEPEPAFIEAGGLRLRYLKLGEGEGAPFILVHGFGGDLNNWLFNQQALAEDRPAYALDLPGHGGSAKDVGAGNVAAQAAALAAFLDALGIARAHLVGHSLGAATILQLALDQPARAASLTLLCPAGLGPEIGLDYIDGFIEATRPKKLKATLELLVADPSLVTSDMVEEVLRYKRLDGVEQALATLRKANFDGGRQATDLRGRLGELKVPVQVIWGAEDKVIPASQAQGLPSTVKVNVLPGAGHLAHMEKANDVNGAILAQARA